MLRTLLITVLLCSCMALSAQFHTVSPHTARYRIERVTQGTAGKTTGKTEKAASAESSTDTASMRKQWIDSYLSVSYPLKEIYVTSPFGVRTDPFTKKRKRHNGVDLRADRCETYAMMHGIVVKVDQDRVSGKYVTVRHGDFSVSYCHQSECRVKKGDCVRLGEVVGISGNTGRSTGPHLHLTVRIGRRRINPGLLLRFIDETRRQALEKAVRVRFITLFYHFGLHLPLRLCHKMPFSMIFLRISSEKLAGLKQKQYLCIDSFHHASFQCVPGWNFCFLYTYGLYKTTFGLSPDSSDAERSGTHHQR